MTDTRTNLTAIERAQAELDELVHLAVVSLAAEVKVPEEALDRLTDSMREIAQKAQEVVLTRLKTRAYEIRESHHNAGADEAMAADTWDAAVEAADPAMYDIMWMRGWKP